MLNNQEVENLKQLLSSQSRTDFELGLLLLENNLVQAELFMHILVMQILFNGNVRADLDAFLIKKGLKSLFKTYHDRLNLLKWVNRKVKRYDYKLYHKPEEELQVATDYVVAHWAEIKTFLFNNALSHYVLDELWYYFFHRAAYYIIATEIVWFMYQKYPNQGTTKNLIYTFTGYHFWHNNRLDMLTPLVQEALKFQQDQKLMKGEQFKFIWLEGLLYFSVNQLDKAETVWVNGLGLFDTYPELKGSLYTEEHIAFIQFGLNQIAYKKANLADAKFYHLQLINEGIYSINNLIARINVLILQKELEQAFDLAHKNLDKYTVNIFLFNLYADLASQLGKKEAIIDAWMFFFQKSPQWGLVLQDLVKLLPNSTRPNAQELLVLYQNKLADWEKAMQELNKRLL